MSEIKYENIQEAWELEVETERLQDLQDLRLRRMIDYLSKVRLQLAETEDELQSDLLNQEGQNLEFMMRDLLMIRRDKILKAVLEVRRPQGIMTLLEEELHSRLSRGINGHLEFVNDSLRGVQQKTRGKKTVPGKSYDGETDDLKEIDYVTVRFLEPTDTPAEGLDGKVYGPYKREDIARIPSSTALVWINQQIAVRVMIDDIGD